MARLVGFAKSLNTYNLKKYTVIGFNHQHHNYFFIQCFVASSVRKILTHLMNNENLKKENNDSELKRIVLYNSYCKLNSG